MRLSRLRLKNIRSYETADVSFTEGTTLIVGDVGSGKTSLLYAIEMALFGVAEVNAAYLVRHGAGHAEVSVEFEGDEKRYEISRRFRRLRRKGQETFEAERIRFTEGGAETAYSATELRQRVIDLLGFPDNPSPQAHSDLWRWAVYVPQERMRDILGARPQDRLETVRKALGVERYRTAAENAQELATDLRRTAAARRAEADRLRHFDEEFAEASALGDRLRLDRVELERSLAGQLERVSALETTRKEAEERARRAEADDRELESLEREAETDRSSLEAALAELPRRQSEAARLTEELHALERDANGLDPSRAALTKTEQELSRARAELDRRAADLRSLAGARALKTSAEEREQEAQMALDHARAEEGEAGRVHEEALAEGPSKEPPAPAPDPLSRIEERLAIARGDETTALQRLTQAESSLAELEELLRGGVCPRCHQPVRPAEFAPHRSEARASVQEAKARLSAAEELRAHTEQERNARERYERASERWKEVEKRRKATGAARERAARAAQTAARKLESAHAAGEEARGRLAQLLPRESEEAAVRERVAGLEAATAEKTREVERAVRAVERRGGIERSMASIEGELGRIEREVVAVRVRLETRGQRVAALRSVRASSDALSEAARSATRQLSDAQNSLAETRAAKARLDTRLDEADRRVRSAERGRQERAELTAEAREIDDKATWVGTAFRSAVLDMEQKLLTHAQGMFEREFARYFASLVDDPALVARTDPAFTPLVMIEGEWTPAEALSGGERTSLALAFRLALARVVRSMGSLHLDTILLDEPTDGFSPEQVIRMGELLEELALPQVILVSHESQLAAIADRVVRVQKVEGRSVLDTTAPSPAGANGPPSPVAVERTA